MIKMLKISAVATVVIGQWSPRGPPPILIGRLLNHRTIDNQGSET